MLKDESELSSISSPAVRLCAYRMICLHRTDIIGSFFSSNLLAISMDILFQVFERIEPIRAIFFVAVGGTPTAGT